MNKVIICIVLITLLSCKEKNQKTYNNADMSKENLFGITLMDPYRFLENIEDSSVVKIYEENTLKTDKILSKILQKSTLKATNLESKISMIKTSSFNHFFFLKTDAFFGINKLYFKKDIDSKEKLIFDPRTSKRFKNSKYEINYFSPNWRGDQVVISLTANDNEISELILLDVHTKKEPSKIFKNAWPSALGGVRWMPDDSGFTYEYIPVIDKNSKEYLLNIETRLYTIAENQEKVIFSKSNNPEINMMSEDFPEVNFRSPTSEFMFANVSGAIYYADYYYAPLAAMSDKKIKWQTFFKREDLIKSFRISDDHSMIFISGKDSPNFKICKTSLLKPNITNPTILVEEDPKAVISDIALTDHGLFYVKMINGVRATLYRLLENQVEEVPLPKNFGNINVISNGFSSDDLWIEGQGWNSMKERYRMDLNTFTFSKENLYTTQTERNIHLEDIVIEEIEVSSHDGEKVPLSLIYKRGLKKNNENYLMITAYGAYKYVLKPKTDDYIKEWVSNGGIYAVAHVRGGGEKGNSWYQGGFKKTKPNSWKDLIACSEYLIENGYSSPKKTGVWGGSAGGITIGRAVTERPELYAAAAIRVGLLNTTRLEFGPNGKNNTKEFGTITDSLEAGYLLEMDAYQHIRSGIKYPAFYITAGMNDSRVPAWQPAKFALKMQDSSASDRPVLLDVDFEGGHGLDASAEKRNDQVKKVTSFLFWQMGHPAYQPED